MTKPSNRQAMNEILAAPYESFGPLLKYSRKNTGVTAAQYSEQAQIHINSQSNYENSKREPSIDYLINFCSSLGISFWQIIYRRVELSSAPSGYKQYIMREIEPFYPHLVANSKNQPAPKEAEPQQSNSTNKGVVDACYDFLVKLRDNPNIEVFNQKGNSMVPTVNEGSQLFVDTQLKQLTEGEIFVFELQNAYSAKRVQLLPNDGVMLVSDNASFHPVSLNKQEVSELKILGKLLYNINSLT